MAVRSLFPILSTTDLPRLVDFYRSALGAEIVYRFADGAGGDAYVSLDLGGASLGVGADPAVPPRSGDRMALWFYVDDVDDAHAAALAAGASAERAPEVMPWGERVSQVRDPDGNLVNLATPPAV
ncbi:VOC family protein [Microbacterium sp. RD1]|uniref:VOC family protein n=1 Tax=Microbacterium sp. RD1 TaxID=3457313 RepID=UPI003FA54389